MRLEHQALQAALKALVAAPANEWRALPRREQAIALYALPKNAVLTPVRTLLANALQKNFTPQWVKTNPADEVFLTITALWQHNPKLIGGDTLAAAVKRLIACETAAGGPYYNHEGRVEPGLNAIIALLAQKVAQPLPNVQTFLQNATHSSPLLAPAGLAYILTQARIAPSATLATPLQAAVALFGVAQAGVTDHAKHIILSQQQSNGLWPAEAFFTGHKSNIVTNAIIVGTLARQQKPTAPPNQSLHLDTLRTAARLLPRTPVARKLLGTIQAVDVHYEITLLPFLFAKALQAPISKKQCQLLCVANVCGWIAYTVFDDFLDGTGQPAHLPLACQAIRRSLTCFGQATNSPAFAAYLQTVFDTMDTANRWEATKCRLPVTDITITINALPRQGLIRNTAERSLAHILGPMAAVMASTTNPERIRLVETSLKHYLTARQLNDDLHDWQQDTRAGHVSYVVAAILNDAGVSQGQHKFATLIPIMQRCFRQTTMPRVAKQVLQHIAKARLALQKSQLVQDDSAIDQLFNVQAATAETSLSIHVKSQAFVQHFAAND